MENGNVTLTKRDFLISVIAKSHQLRADISSLEIILGKLRPDC